MFDLCGSRSLFAIQDKLPRFVEIDQTKLVLFIHCMFIDLISVHTHTHTHTQFRAASPSTVRYFVNLTSSLVTLRVGMVGKGGLLEVSAEW